MQRVVRILHLEDNPRDAEVIAGEIETSGVACDITHVSASGGFLAALEQQGAFDVILCDYNVPGYGGMSALAAAREKQPGVPVLVISGAVGEEEAIRCLHAGATDYVLKQRLQRLGPALARALQEVEANRARRHAETALRESEERFRRLAEQSADVFWFIGLNPERLLYVSPAVERIWRIPVERCYEQPRFWIDAIHPDDRERVQAAFAAFQAGQTSRFEEEFRLVCPDGSVRRVLDRGILTRDEAGCIIGSSGVARDITELKQLEDQFRHAQKMEAIGRLASGIAHDFNNALTVIRGSAELVLQQLDDGHPSRCHLGEVLQATESAARLTRQLLAFSRKQILQPVVLDINATIEQSQQMISRLLGENVEFTMRLGTHVGRVKADPGQLEQVLMNLAVNARDAMPLGGSLTIQSADVDLDAPQARQAGLAPGAYVLLTVSDTGEGMAPEVQARLFEPFFTTKGPDKGTGLGLATVYGIIKQSGGNIRVSSEPGRGTAFHLYLPRVEPDADTGVTSPASEEDIEARAAETILLVEDQEGLLALMATILERSGYRVLAARKPSEACAIAGRHPGPLHMLLTDVVLPETDGRTLARMLTETRPDLRVLYMSGYVDSVAGGDGMGDQGMALLQKPFTSATLTATVRQLLAPSPAGT